MRNQTDKPNIILINCDDLGYGDIGCYGSDSNSTPYIDRMADEGLKLTDFYMASPVCSPSRAAMLTGCYPQRVGIPSVLMPISEIGLDPNEETISSVLKGKGYRTRLVGKWHLGDQPEFLPTRHGFDEYFGIPYSNGHGRMVPNPEDAVPRRGMHTPLPLMRGEEVVQEQPSQEGLTERYTEDAIRFLRENRDTPFFLYFAHMHVHRPILVSRRFTEVAKNGRYGAAVEAIDWSVGSILYELKTLGLDKNTIVIFTSDNGSNGNLGGSNGPLRGFKGTTWEGGMRLPFIIRWPGQIPAGTISGSLATSLDLLPTLAHITDSDLQSNNLIDGENIEDVIFQQQEVSSHRPFFYYLQDTLCAVRYGRWKLHVARAEHTRNRTGGYRSTSPLTTDTVLELYDLSSDIHEDHNVAESNKEVVADLLEMINACRTDLGDGHTQTQGANMRLPRRVSDPVALCVYDADAPILWAEYDLDEFG